MANLALRFALEVTALIGFGLAAWDVASGPWRWLLVVGVPLLAATIWGTFAVPDDASRSGNAPIPVSGRLRLAIEFVILGGGILSYALVGHLIVAGVLAALLVLHYAISRDRIVWLLGR